MVGQADFRDSRDAVGPGQGRAAACNRGAAGAVVGNARRIGKGGVCLVDGGGQCKGGVAFFVVPRQGVFVPFLPAAPVTVSPADLVQLSGGCYDARALTGDVVQAAARVLNVATGDDGAVVVGDVACQLHVAACGDAPGVAGNDPVFSSGLHAVFKQFVVAPCFGLIDFFHGINQGINRVVIRFLVFIVGFERRLIFGLPRTRQPHDAQGLPLRSYRFERCIVCPGLRAIKSE